MTLPIDRSLLNAEIVLHEEILIAVPKNSSLYRKLVEKCVRMEGRKYPAVDIRLLDDENFVMLRPMQAMQKMLNALCDEYDFRPKEVITVQGSDAKLNMVRAGLGAALIPEGADVKVSEEEGAEDRVVYFSVIQELPRREVAVVWRKEHRLTKPQRCLIDILQGCYQ